MSFQALVVSSTSIHFLCMQYGLQSVRCVNIWTIRVQWRKCSFMKSLDSSSNTSIAGRDRIKYLALLDPGSTEDNTVLFSNVVGKEHKSKVQMLIPPAIVTQWNPKMTCVETAKQTLTKPWGTSTAERIGICMLVASVAMCIGQMTGNSSRLDRPEIGDEDVPIHHVNATKTWQFFALR
jgi:hypothetical protein